MPVSHEKLTLRAVEAAIKAKDFGFIWDGVVTGFAVRITRSGVATYIVQYRFGGQTRRYKIGRHGAPWTVETARAQALAVLGRVVQGEDPQASKFRERRAMTVAQLCDLYVAEGLATRKESSRSAARSDIENHIKPMLGSKRADLVTREDVDHLLLAIAEGKTARQAKTRKKQGVSRVRGGKGAANSSIRTLSAAFGFAVARGIRRDNPAWRVRRFPERKCARFLSPEELGRLGEAIAAAEALGVECRYGLAAIKLLILTGCRRDEILTLRHAHVDRHHRCLRLPDSKTGAKVVHVGPAVLKLIEDLPMVPGNPFVLPGPGAEGRIINIQKAWTRVRNAAGLADVRLHDLRHSFASLGVAGGASLFVVGSLLGHRSAKTTQRYAHLADHPLKSAADQISAEAALLIGADMGDPLPPEDEREAAMRRLRDAAAVERAVSVIGEIRRARWLSTQAAADLLGNTKGTLQTWRWMGVGPPFRKIGRRVVYAAADLEAWARREGVALAAAATPVVIPPGATNVVSLSARRAQRRSSA